MSDSRRSQEEKEYVRNQRTELIKCYRAASAQSCDVGARWRLSGDSSARWIGRVPERSSRAGSVIHGREICVRTRDVGDRAHSCSIYTSNIQKADKIASEKNTEKIQNVYGEKSDFRCISNTWRKMNFHCFR